ncbi:unnamed protein product [Closterium sp. Naga37s-1]|nr:unnamed protein product [Closterium sp. Naga37s-1]
MAPATLVGARVFRQGVCASLNVGALERASTSSACRSVGTRALAAAAAASVAADARGLEQGGARLSVRAASRAAPGGPLQANSGGGGDSSEGAGLGRGRIAGWACVERCGACCQLDKGELAPPIETILRDPSELAVRSRGSWLDAIAPLLVRCSPSRVIAPLELPASLLPIPPLLAFAARWIAVAPCVAGVPQHGGGGRHASMRQSPRAVRQDPCVHPLPSPIPASHVHPSRLPPARPRFCRVEADVFWDLYRIAPHQLAATAGRCAGSTGGMWGATVWTQGT